MTTTAEKISLLFLNCNNYKASIAIVLIILLIILSLLGFIAWKRQHNMIERYKKVIESLKKMNFKLSEDNRKRNEYIFLFGQMCRDFIDRHANYQKTILRLNMKEHKTDMTEILVFQAEIEKQGHELYALFDSAFTDLYPDFVKKFNLLLKEGEQYKLKNNTSLNPELRIFALRYLGIEDYCLIAKFLHYKMQTIYNYRAEVRAKAISGKAIEQEILKI